MKCKCTTFGVLVFVAVHLIIFVFSLNALAEEITIGETDVLTTRNDSGNRNLLLAQSCTLPQTATIISMSFYVQTADGNLRLGIYDSTGPDGGPGVLLASTEEFMPTAGWNIQNVISQVELSAGTYWLAYLPSSNNLAFKVTSSGSTKYYNYTYGELPSSFSTSPTSATCHWSLYATLIPTEDSSSAQEDEENAEEENPNTETITIGETEVLTGREDSGNGNLLLAQSCALSQAATIVNLSFYVQTAAGKLRLGIYDDSGQNGDPGMLVASTDEFTPTTGWNTQEVTFQEELSAGTYWLAYLPSNNKLSFRVDSTGTTKYFQYTYGELPSSFSTSPTSTKCHWSFYATLIPQNIPLEPDTPEEGNDEAEEAEEDSTEDGTIQNEWPDETNTGVLPGTQIAPWIPVTITDGTVLENKEITVGLDISASNIIIRNCRIATYNEVFGIYHREGTNLLVEDCEIYDTSNNGGYTGFAGSNLTIRRCNIYNWENSGSAGSNVVVEDSYLHDHAYREGAHVDGIEWGLGSNVVIQNNRIAIVDQTSCVNIGGVSGSVTNIQVLNNLFYGGTYSLALEGRKGTTILNTTIADNVWVKDSYLYGTHAISNVDAAQVHWSNNRFDDGTIISQ